jgi:paraquat-inducible protein B
LARTQAVLVDLNRRVHDATERLAASEQSHHVREANEQLVISSLNAHTAAERAERSRRDRATSYERRVRKEARANEALAKLNIDLESRVSERTRQLEVARDARRLSRVAVEPRDLVGCCRSHGADDL